LDLDTSKIIVGKDLVQLHHYLFPGKARVSVDQVCAMRTPVLVTSAFSFVIAKVKTLICNNVNYTL